MIKSHTHLKFSSISIKFIGKLVHLVVTLNTKYNIRTFTDEELRYTEPGTKHGTIVERISTCQKWPQSGLENCTEKHC